MKITVWGSRGSIPSPSPETNKIGGNTSCIQVMYEDTFLILDAGSGIKRLNNIIPKYTTRIDILLTHLHMDHILGLGFFAPLYNPNMKVNIWGPTSTIEDLQTRLTRYLSPPLFPIRLQDLPCQLQLLEINHSTFQVGTLTIHSSYVCHPGPTLGFRIESKNSVMTYIPDHEPVLGSIDFPNQPHWTSGYDLAKDADLLFHDAQFTEAEYEPRIGWGHSTMKDALLFAKMTGVKHLQFFHHDPTHTDLKLEEMLTEEMNQAAYDFTVGVAAEEDIFVLK